MNRRRIYELLCQIIKEAEIGKKECIREDFAEHRLCTHAWENIENLVAEIREAITAEDRAFVERGRIKAITEDIYPTHRPFNDFPKSNNI